MIDLGGDTTGNSVSKLVFMLLPSRPSAVARFILRPDRLN
jgi:hypothetical protein